MVCHSYHLDIVSGNEVRLRRRGGGAFAPPGILVLQESCYRGDQSCQASNQSGDCLNHLHSGLPPLLFLTHRFTSFRWLDYNTFDFSTEVKTAVASGTVSASGNDIVLKDNSGFAVNDTIYFKTVAKDKLRLVSHLSNEPGALAPEHYEIIKEK